MMRMTTGCRLSNPNRRKAVKIHVLMRSSDYTRHPMDKWLTLVCVNESKNYIKLFFRNHLNTDDTEIVSPETFDTLRQKDLFNAVMELPKKERTVIHLFYYEDLSVKDIAEILRIKESAVKTRLSRARNKLKENLGDDWINE